MWTRLSSVVADVIVGLLMAGVFVALLVPVAGRHVGPGTAFAIAALSVAGVLLVGRIVRRGRAADRR